MEEGRAKGHRQPLEAGEAKKTSCPLEPPGKNELCQHLDFSSVATILDF